MYLLRFTKKGKCLNDDVYSVPQFAEVLNKAKYGEQLFYAIALSVDYKSLFRMYKEEDRFSVALKNVFGKTRPDGVPINSKFIKECMDAYRQLQYDDLEEDLRVVRKKVQEINNLLEITAITEKNADFMQKLLLSRDKFIDQRSKIEKMIEKRGEMSDLQLGDSVVMSRLERKLAAKELLG